MVHIEHFGKIAPPPPPVDRRHFHHRCFVFAGIILFHQQTLEMDEMLCSRRPRV